MRTLIPLLAVLLWMPGGDAAARAKTTTARVLFVGNSLTYVGNLPAVFSAMTRANGHPVDSDMIVRGGATLAQRLDDGTIAKALDSRKYSVLVLQERGGELICAFGAESCADSRAALDAIAGLAKQNGVATIVLLGTYQSLPAASTATVEREAAAAAQAGLAYVEVSQTLGRLVALRPGAAWFDTDGVHPGRDLTLLQAVLLYRPILGTLPAAEPVFVSAPIYGVQSGLTERLRAANAPAPQPRTRRAISFSAKAVRELLDSLPADR